MTVEYQFDLSSFYKSFSNKGSLGSTAEPWLITCSPERLIRAWWKFHFGAWPLRREQEVGASACAGTQASQQAISARILWACLSGAVLNFGAACTVQSWTVGAIYRPVRPRIRILI